jgi:hypothetical protein
MAQQRDHEKASGANQGQEAPGPESFAREKSHFSIRELARAAPKNLVLPGFLGSDFPAPEPERKSIDASAAFLRVGLQVGSNSAAAAAETGSRAGSFRCPVCGSEKHYGRCISSAPSLTRGAADHTGAEPPAEHRPPLPTAKRDGLSQPGSSAGRRPEHCEERSPEQRGGWMRARTAVERASNGAAFPARALAARPAVGRPGADKRRDQEQRDRERRLADARRQHDPPNLRRPVPLGKLQVTPDEPKTARPSGRVWELRSQLGMGDLPGEWLLGQEAAWKSLAAGALRRLPSAEGQRERAWTLRDAARATHPSHRCASCGWARIGEVGVCAREVGGFALASVATCGSVWLCPVCALVIKGKRAEEIKAGVELHRQHFGAESLVLNTYTIRHQDGQPLEEIADGFQRAWNRFKTRIPTRTKEARRLARAGLLPLLCECGNAGCGGCRSALFVETPAEKVGAIGGVYGAEVTHGRNGWHYHRHEVLALDRNVTPDEIAEFAREQGAWWAECVAIEMGPEFVPSVERGFDSKRLNVAEYLSKLGLEVSDVGVKKAKVGNDTPWGILQAAAEGDLLALEYAGEYARAMKGRKCVQFSERLLERWQALGWKHDPNETELADESKGARIVLEVPAPAWSQLRRSGGLVQALQLPSVPEMTAALRALAPAGWEALEAWGDGARVEFEEDRARDLAEDYAVRTEGGGKRETPQARREREAFKRARFREALHAIAVPSA